MYCIAHFYSEMKDSVAKNCRMFKIVRIRLRLVKKIKNTMNPIQDQRQMLGMINVFKSIHGLSPSSFHVHQATINQSDVFDISD